MMWKSFYYFRNYYWLPICYGYHPYWTFTSEPLVFWNLLGFHTPPYTIKITYFKNNNCSIYFAERIRMNKLFEDFWINVICALLVTTSTYVIYILFQPICRIKVTYLHDWELNTLNVFKY